MLETWDRSRGQRVPAQLNHMPVISPCVLERKFSHGTSKARWRTELPHRRSELSQE